MNFNNIDKQINITQDGKDNTIIITIPSQPTQLQANPFTPPQPLEGGLFGGEEE
ncbi:hypothetical protein H5968_23505 [Sphaerospermopsis sp. LEGE 00249]|jgi:hypothetical protein|uniref:hypothetical protein n=1 Tax=Sphaerospermopsis sp. LEGE 00249 TaxID=1380707 RepID=UPI00164E3584|nr:hypothetical protein [Sphaerospermopsis sp. LEGE 00249]MBC5798030.1 hypothetical protein [Sphaerospermopsis sp. LEGE 00249]